MEVTSPTCLRSYHQECLKSIPTITHLRPLKQIKAYSILGRPRGWRRFVVNDVSVEFWCKICIQHSLCLCCTQNRRKCSHLGHGCIWRKIRKCLILSPIGYYGCFLELFCVCSGAYCRVRQESSHMGRMGSGWLWCSDFDLHPTL